MAQAPDVLVAVLKNYEYITSHAKSMYIWKMMGYAGQQDIINWSKFVNSNADLALEAKAIYIWGSEAARKNLDKIAIEYCGYDYMKMFEVANGIIAKALTYKFDNAQELWATYMGYKFPQSKDSNLSGGLGVGPVLAGIYIFGALAALIAAMYTASSMYQTSKDADVKIFNSDQSKQAIQASQNAIKAASTNATQCLKNVQNDNSLSPELKLAFGEQCGKTAEGAYKAIAAATPVSAWEVQGEVEKDKLDKQSLGFFGSIYNAVGTVGTVAVFAAAGYVGIKYAWPAFAKLFGKKDKE